MTSSYSKTCTCVCPHENAKRAFSKNSTLGTMLKNLRFYAWNRHTGVGGRLSKKKKRLVWCMASSYSKTCVCVCPRENAKRAFPKNSTLGTLFKNLRFYAWKHRTGVRLIKGKKTSSKISEYVRTEPFKNIQGVNLFLDCWCNIIAIEWVTLLLFLDPREEFSPTWFQQKCHQVW